MSQTELTGAPAAYPTMTYVQFLEYPFERNDLEWVNGEVVELSPVGDRHQDVLAFFMTVLRLFVQDRGLGQVRSDPFQMKAGPELPGRAPDVQIVLKEHEDRIRRNHTAGPADLVIEIVSPGSGRVDRGDKFYEYEKGGVREYWIIDPERKVAEFYVLGEDQYYHPALPNNDGRYSSAIIEGLWIDVAWLWQEPLPRVLDVARQWGIL
jgi:Uma2 family endonuclease